MVKNPDLPSEELPEVPKEEGARGTNLYYCVTGIDAWGNSGAKAKAKKAEYYVTPEGWYRNGVMQIPGGVAGRVDTPIRPDQTLIVKVMVRMVVVPFKGVYSVGAELEVIEEKAEPKIVTPTTDKEVPTKRLRAWFQRSLSGGGKPKDKDTPSK